MMYVAIILAALLALDAFRMRGRLSALPVLPDSDGEPDVVFVTVPGVTLADETRRAAAAYMYANKIAVLDLVPRDLPSIRAMSLAQVVDPKTYAKDRVAPGRSAGHAVAITKDVAARARLAEITDEADYYGAAARLKQFAPGASGLAIAPHEHAVKSDLSRRYDVLRVIFGASTPFMLIVQPVFWILMGLSVWLAPKYGLIALGVWLLQTPIAILGTPIRSRDVLPVTLLRAPIELWILLRTFLGRRAAIEQARVRRPTYDQLLAGGTARFFEPRRETCPICESKDLVVQVRARDMLQHKPGTFTLERCRGCGHVFQNPRLTLDGLDFYYKDFYDGLGEAGMELIFGFGSGPYHDRAKMVAATGKPSRWLDVGAGHGHFCCAARDELPDTHFDGLDLSESIEEAERRGWIERGYRGLFPELAPSIAGKYDAISMSHYLEHTLDPRKELAAAHTALAPGGRLLIEVPDPECKLGRLLGRFWLPWFQPQHQHLLPASGLEKLLKEAGFTPLKWHRGEAHQRIDFFFAVCLLLGRLGPPARLPWRWRGAATTAKRIAVYTIGAPFMLVSMIVDHALSPVIRRTNMSNTYRVVAARN